MEQNLAGANTLPRILGPVDPDTNETEQPKNSADNRFTSEKEMHVRHKQSGREQEQKKAERVARLQQYRQGVWELNFDFHAFECWRQVGLTEGLTSDTEIAHFLLHHYEKTRSQTSYPIKCSKCGTVLVLSCYKCESTINMSGPPKFDSAAKKIPVEDDAGNQEFKKLETRKEQELSCSVCKATFTRGTSLKAHMRKHTGEKPYICNICGAMFSQSSNLSVHKRSHTGLKRFVCDQCGAAFTVSSVLRQHMRKHSGEKPFKCKLCPSAFTQSSKLTIHMRKHTGVRPYQCEFCGSAFTHSHRLKIHLRSHNGDRPYKCQECGKGFAQSAHLTVHTRIHTGDKPFKCKECKAVFLDSTHLRRHEQTHALAKPHRCLDCGTAYSTAFALHRHEWTHTKQEKRFKCRGCLKAFSSNFSLKRHVERMKGKCKPQGPKPQLQTESLADN